ncbi:hypothetical protein M378DRAFT_73316 [Amanita muscaria Koide BX008]|uniref:Putative gamma-glutamylcyclotransferase n=1 Tax=Amanita muscaria (strain Koide BX008) TaxID=946122 RepID=A0A0C2X0M4_AMAMK|nr:hypothetical protein M378DRAFT_73316 [Amanita muscaria Koide BX008]
MAKTGSESAFFYGTLMHPKILRRVIKNDGKHLKICPAVLSDYTRHRIRNEDYPGLVPYDKGKKLLNRELAPDERCTRGTLVIGLTAADLRRVDAFEEEGDVYIREAVRIRALEEPITLEEFVDEEGHDRDLVERIMPTHLPISEILEKIESEAVETETYVYQDVTVLESELWSFADFLRDKASPWLDGSRQEYYDTDPEPKEGPETEFDRRIRQSDGVTA